MKAKVIKTGEIVDAYHEPQHGQITNIYKESVLVNGRMWTEDELDFCVETNEVPQQYISKSALIAEIEKLYNGEIDTYTRDILGRLKFKINTLEVKEVPEWKPAAIAYKKDRLPRYDSALKRIVDRDEGGCYFLTMDDLHKLPKVQKGE